MRWDGKSERGGNGIQQREGQLQEGSGHPRGVTALPVGSGPAWGVSSGMWGESALGGSEAEGWPSVKW